MSTTETSSEATEPTPKVKPVRAKKRRKSRGQRVEMTPEQQALAMRYLPLARTLARPIKLKWMKYHDEFDSAAVLALVEAAQAFDPRRNVKFATFARVRILGGLADIQRHIVAKEYPREMPNVPRSYHFVPGTDERGQLMLTSPEPEVGTDAERAEQVERWFRTLPPRHASACREIYLNGRTQGEAAEAIGCVKSRVCVLHAESIDMLRNSPAVREAALAIGLDVGLN